MLAGLLAAVWAIVELAPERDGLSEDQLSPIHATHRVSAPMQKAPAFAVTERPRDARLCAWTADQIFNHFEPLSDGVNVAFHARGVEGLLEAYLDLQCPAAIHEGEWHSTAQVLGVGLVYRVLAGQAAIYDSEVVLDERAEVLVPLAVHSYDILAPTRICEQAVRHHDSMISECLAAFGR